MLQIRADEKIEHELITIKKYEINENVIIANSISPVKGDKVISNIINISEQPFMIEQLTTSNLKWEPYNENVFIASEESPTDNKIKKIKATINTEHLNNEERDSNHTEENVLEEQIRVIKLNQNKGEIAVIIYYKCSYLSILYKLI